MIRSIRTVFRRRHAASLATPARQGKARPAAGRPRRRDRLGPCRRRPDASPSRRSAAAGRPATSRAARPQLPASLPGGMLRMSSPARLTLGLLLGLLPGLLAAGASAPAAAQDTLRIAAVVNDE